MSANAVGQGIALIALLLGLAWPLGRYITGVMNGSAWVVRVGAPLERGVYWLAGVDPEREMGAKHYAFAVLLFNVLGVVVLYSLLRLQAYLPWQNALNPQQFAGMRADTALNTAVSFVTNTNWQAYSGESTLSYALQMLGLTVQNFLSAATGIAVAIALIRGLARHSSGAIGHFWVDLTRITLYILLPLSMIVSVILMSQGVIQNFSAYKTMPVLQSTTYEQPRMQANGQAVLDKKGKAVQETVSVQTQTVPMGPVASQEAIKMLGTNGGGFFNANSAHPFENPTPLSNLVQILAMLLIPAALCFVFGRMVGDKRQGWAVFAAMGIAFSVACLAQIRLEQSGNPNFAHLGIDQRAQATEAPIDAHTRTAQADSVWQAGGNMEGKETRFGIVQSALFSIATTSASCGAVNTMHDSLTPLGGMVPLLLMQLGEVIFGGTGSGLYGMLVFALLAVFVAGLMIGRTPEYVGKKIEAFEIKMLSLVILLTPFLVLVGSSIAVLTAAGAAGVANPGPHGFSEILYALTSTANNNGSAFAGLSVNTPFYNSLLAFAMWLGRFGTIIPILAIAGSLAAKKRLSASVGSMPTHGPLFVLLLLGTVLLVGALTYLPSLALGPIAETVIQVAAVK